MPKMKTTAFEIGETSRLPAGPILVRLRRVLVTTAIAALAYTVLSTGSVGTCTDASTDGQTRVTCANLSLHPSGYIYAAFAVILFVAIGRVARQATTVADALRILDRTATLIVVLALGSAAIGLLWMFLVPRESLTAGGTLIFPFPFSSPELSITGR